jgi:hypothetical protein
MYQGTPYLLAVSQLALVDEKLEDILLNGGEEEEFEGDITHVTEEQ